MNRLLLLTHELKVGKDFEETLRGLVLHPSEPPTESQVIQISALMCVCARTHTPLQTAPAATVRLKQKRQISQSRGGKSVSHACWL